MIQQSALFSAILCLFLTTTGCSGGTPLFGDGASGIAGVAIIGPLNPVSRPGEPDSRPLADATITILPDGGGAEIARQKTDGTGRFRIALRPGRYRLVPFAPDPRLPLPRAEPQAIVVEPGRFAEVTVDFDSGIR